jgi:hypothetical protein
LGDEILSEEKIQARKIGMLDNGKDLMKPICELRAAQDKGVAPEVGKEGFEIGRQEHVRKGNLGFLARSLPKNSQLASMRNVRDPATLEGRRQGHCEESEALLSKSCT